MLHTIHRDIQQCGNINYDKVINSNIDKQWLIATVINNVKQWLNSLFSKFGRDGMYSITQNIEIVYQDILHYPPKCRLEKCSVPPFPCR